MIPEKMKAVVKSEASPGARCVEVEVPPIRPGHVLVKVLSTAICGTDLHIYDWTEWAQSRIAVPMVFGHEFCGRVIEVGENVTKTTVGDLVAGETHIPCGKCYQCNTGLQHVCQHMAILGVHSPGVFSEYALVPEPCIWKLPASTDPDIGAIYEPFGVAAHAVLVESVAGKSVAVFGCGPIGLFAVGIARASGAAEVIACEISPDRLTMATPMGATHLVNPAKEDPREKIMDITAGKGLDVAVELSGNPIALEQALASITRGGRLTLAGLPPRPVEINVVDDVIYKELRIYGVTGRVMYDTWYTASSLIESGMVNPQPVITHSFDMCDIDAAMATAKGGRAGKVILHP